MWPLVQLPLHIASVFLLFLGPTDKTFLRAIYNRHATCQDSSARPVFFRPPLPCKGPAAYLIEEMPANRCHPLESLLAPRNTSTAVVVLIHRSDGIFGDQGPKCQGAILHNVNSQALVNMAIGSGENRQQIKMPSALTEEAASQHLRKTCSPDEGAHLILVTEYHHSSWEEDVGNSCPRACRCRIQLPGRCFSVPLLPVCRAISTLAAVVTGILLIVNYTMRYHSGRMRRNLLSEVQGKKFKRSTFNRGARYTECAICLEMYEKGDRLKILSCSHAYHGKCIDLWLLTQTRKKTCPLCMQRVIVAAESPDLDIEGHIEEERAEGNWEGEEDGHNREQW